MGAFTDIDGGPGLGGRSAEEILTPYIIYRTTLGTAVGQLVYVHSLMVVVS